MTLSYEEPADPGRRGRRERNRPPRGRPEPFPLRDGTLRPPGRDAQVADGPGPGSIPQPRVHPEPSGPIRARHDSRNGSSCELEGDPLLPVLPRGTSPGPRARPEMGPRLTDADVG